jgi:hypothetical protein
VRLARFSRRGWVAVAATALALGGGLAVAVGAFGGDGGSPMDFDVPEGVEPLGQMRAGSVASLVECNDWDEGSVERKQATVVDVREQLAGGGVPEGRPSLPDQEAYDVFERACSAEFTGRFQLYKIYYRAAAFYNFDPQDLIDAHPPETLVPETPDTTVPVLP